MTSSIATSATWCATHGAIFRVEDGVCLAGPCQGDQLEPWPVIIREGGIWDASATLPVTDEALPTRRNDGDPDR